MLVDEQLTAGDEVGEGVLLLEQLAVFVPLFAEVASAADLGDGEDEAAVDEAVIGGAEVDVGAAAVRSVGVEQGGRRCA